MANKTYKDILVEKTASSFVSLMFNTFKDEVRENGTYSWTAGVSSTASWISDDTTGVPIPGFNSSLHNLSTVHNSSINQPLDTSSKETTKLVFQIILLIIVGLIGLFGNLSGIRHFITLDRPLKFHWLMTTLFIFHTIFILTMFIIFTLPYLSEDYKKSTHMYVGPKVLPFLQMAMTGSLYCQIAFTIERYLVVCHPFYIVAKEWSVKRYIIPLVTFSIFYNLPKFFEIDTSVCEGSLKHQIHKNRTIFHGSYHNENESYYEITSMRQHYLYKDIYLTGMNITFMLIGPFLILIVLNTLTLMNLKQYQTKQRRDSEFFKYGVDSAMLPKLKPNKDKSGSRSGREVTLVKISLAIVCSSILCHSVKWVPTIYEFADKEGYEQSMHDGWIESFEHVSHFLLVFDASISFYIYLFTRSKPLLTKLSRRFSNRASKPEKNSSNGKPSKPTQYSIVKS